MNATPKISVICATTACNSCCSYCDIWTQQGIDSTEKNLLLAINSSASLGVELLAFTGGEPLLMKDIEYFVSYSKSIIPFVTLSTNAILLSNTRMESLENSGLDALVISLDTLVPSTYQKFRGISIDYVLRGIECAYIKAKNTRVVISCVLSLENIDHLLDLARFCMQRNLILGLNPLHTSKNSAEHKVLSSLEINKIKHIFEQLRSFEVLGLMLANTSEYLDFLFDYIISKIIPLQSYCPNPFKSISISVDGFVRICPYMQPIGSVVDGDILSIWNSDNKDDVMARMNRHECNGCWFSYRSDDYNYILSKYRILPRLL